MVYNMLNPLELEKFKERTEQMITKAEKLSDDFLSSKFFIVELKERKQSRTIQQNRYLWVTITYVAIERGETLDYVESEFKNINKEVFLRERENKMGKKFTYYRHISDIDKEEMSTCIDRWLHYCSMTLGLYIPSPQDHAYMIWEAQVEREKEANKEFL